MPKYVAVAAALAIIAILGGCEKLKGLSKNEPSEPAGPAVAAPAAETAAKKPFRAPTKEEYYRMLRAGYKPPRGIVTGEGYTSSGATPAKRPPLSEAEGDALKAKFGEGRKYAASGRGEEPKAPSYIEHDDGTYPPREFKGHD